MLPVLAPAPTPTEPDPEPDAPEFEDVSAGNVHAEAIDRIRQYSITAGTSETTFGPSGDLPRSQMSTFLVRLLMLTDSSIEQPADHEAAMALLVDKGLLLGDANGDLDGAGTLTRGQAASLLARLVEDVTGDTLTASELEFSDVAAFHVHAENIAKLVEADVIHGYGDNTFRSETELRRDEMASLLSRTIDVLITSRTLTRNPSTAGSGRARQAPAWPGTRGRSGDVADWTFPLLRLSPDTYSLRRDHHREPSRRLLATDE